jgi:hypothetical protein
MKNIRIIQLTNESEEHVGIYMTERTDVENFQHDFNGAFGNTDFDSKEEIQDNADDWLEAHKGIYRVTAEEVFTNSL